MEQKKENTIPRGWLILCVLHHPVRGDAMLCFHAVCVKARPVGQRTQVALSHLDSRLLVDEEEGHIGDANEGPFFVGPEHDDGTSLRGLSCYVEVGEANAAQVGSQTNEDVPSAV